MRATTAPVGLSRAHGISSSSSSSNRHHKAVGALPQTVVGTHKYSQGRSMARDNLVETLTPAQMLQATNVHTRLWLRAPVPPASVLDM